MFQFCKAGFNYYNIDYEVAAKGREHDSDDLLAFGSPGNDFFWIWKFGNLQSQLGSPTARTPSTPPANEASSELQFQKGVIQINRNLYFNPPQYRIFTSDEIIKRNAAQCSTTHPVCAKVKTRDLNARMPMPPGGPIDPLDKCPGQLKIQAIKQCQAAQAEWNTLRNNRPWKRDITIPQRPQTQPPSPSKPGCPPDCHIITLVPASSKSCQLENSPPGCDKEAAMANNKDCRAKLDQCA